MPHTFMCMPRLLRSKAGFFARLFNNVSHETRPHSQNVALLKHNLRIFKIK
jgi:hypothetical protein